MVEALDTEVLEEVTLGWLHAITPELIEVGTVIDGRRETLGCNMVA